MKTLFICMLATTLTLSACHSPAAPATVNVAAQAEADGPPDSTPPVRETTATQPALQVATVDGGRFDLAQQRGQWVVVNFWATWCGPCLKEMPELSALDAQRQDVQVIGLAYEDIGLDEMRAFLKKHPVAYPIAIIDVTAPPPDFATPRGLPTTYLIAPDGTLAEAFAGPITAHDLEAAMAKVKPASTSG